MGISVIKKEPARNVQALFVLWLAGLLTVDFYHGGNQVENLVRVADFVVVPRNNLHEVFGDRKSVV